jgi:putative flippase GtrA
VNPDRTGPRLIGSCRKLIREFDGSFLRFVLVGLSNFAVSFTVFRVLVAVSGSFEYKATFSQVASYAAGTVWSFIWNRRFTFRSKGSIPGQATRFFVLQAVLALVSSGVIGLLVDGKGFPASLTWFVVMGFITVVNYLVSKKWVFR